VTTSLHCNRCDKRLTRKTARHVNSEWLCAKCLFPKLKGGVPEGMVPVSRGPNLGHSISTGTRKD